MPSQITCCSAGLLALHQSWLPAGASVSGPLPHRGFLRCPSSKHCALPWAPCLLLPLPAPALLNSRPRTNSFGSEYISCVKKFVPACRAISRWASASAGFLRRHNPAHSIAESHTLARVRGWRPWPLGQRQPPSDGGSGSHLVAGRAGSGKLTGGEQGPEGRLVPLLTLLMPQTLLVVILRKAQQVTHPSLLDCRCTKAQGIPQDAAGGCPVRCAA